MIKRTLALTTIILCPLAPAFADDWPQWQGPDRTNISKEKGLLDSWPAGGPKLLWTFREAGAGYSCTAIMGNRLYSMGAEDGKEYVFAVDLKTQKKLWSTEIGIVQGSNSWCGGPEGTPTIEGDFLYALGGNADLVCIEIATGKKVWSQQLKKDFGGAQPAFGYSESPLVDGDLVIVTPGGKKGAIAAFVKKTGALKWRSTTFTDRACNASMIAVESGGVRQYVQQTWNKVASVRATDGKVLWQFPFYTAIATPISRNDCVYFSSAHHGSKLIKLRAEGDQVKTENIYVNKGAIKSFYCSIILVGEYAYGYSDKVPEGQGDGWICQEFKTGKEVWKKEPKLGRGSATYADGNLYCYHENKGDMRLIKATPDGYQEKGNFRIPERAKSANLKTYTYPVVADGKLYLRDQELIFCYDVRKP